MFRNAAIAEMPRVNRIVNMEVNAIQEMLRLANDIANVVLPALARPMRRAVHGASATVQGVVVLACTLLNSIATIVARMEDRAFRECTFNGPKLEPMNMHPDEFRALFRFRQRDIMRLTRLLGLLDNGPYIRGSYGHKAPAHVALCMLLYRLSYPHRTYVELTRVSAEMSG